MSPVFAFALIPAAADTLNSNRMFFETEAVHYPEDDLMITLQEAKHSGEDLIVAGIVENQGDIAYQKILLTVRYCDKDWKMITSARITLPEKIFPGDTLSFEQSIKKDERIASVQVDLASASAVAEEDAVPETEEVVPVTEEPVSEAVVSAAPVTEDIDIPERDEPYMAALLIPGIMDSGSFWDSANKGLTALREELGENQFNFDIQEMGDGVDDWASYPDFFLDACESEKYDVIITGSWTVLDAVYEAMDEYPDQHFILFDEEYDFSYGGGNLYNLLFRQNEAGYLAGAEAALLSETGTICFLGGMEGKIIYDFLVGYIQGAKDVRDDIKVDVSFVGDYSDSAKGKDLSLTMFNAGADVGFHVAAAAGYGLFEAAKETGKLAIGVDTDEAGVYSDCATFIPTSAIKNVGAGLARTIKMDMAGRLSYGAAERLGLAENCVGLLDNEHYHEMVPEDIRAQVADLQRKIVSGEIEVLSSETMTLTEIDELIASVAVG